MSWLFRPRCSFCRTRVGLIYLTATWILRPLCVCQRCIRSNHYLQAAMRRVA